MCDLKRLTSSWVNRKAKSSGSRLRLRRTCSLRRLVETPESMARSASGIARWPRTTWIALGICTTGAEAKGHGGPFAHPAGSTRLR